MIYEVKTVNGVKTKVPLTGDGYGLPLGTIIAVYSNTVPDGFLPCNGTTYDTTTYSALYAYLGSNKLPDLRECVLVGAGQSDNDYDANDNPTGIQAHDIYTVGQFKDDQFQGHEHLVPNPHHTTKRAGGDSSTQYIDAPYNVNSQGIVTDGTNGTPRIGSTTHGKQVGVNYCIKATPAYVEPDTVSDMVNTLRTQDSYSTEEVNTGKKWIDGKPIYRITVEDTANVTQGYSAISASAYTILSSKNIDRVITANWNRPARESYGSSSIPLSIVVTSSAILKAGNSADGYAGAYLTLEYTKTTD